MSLEITKDLDKSDVQRLEELQAMHPDELGELMWKEDQERQIRETAAQWEEQERIKQAQFVNRRADGSVTTGGVIEPDTLINVDGMTVTAQQAVDYGIYSGDLIGANVGDLSDEDFNDLKLF